MEEDVNCWMVRESDTKSEEGEEYKVKPGKGA
jgi:hypothetical protein